MGKMRVRWVHDKIITENLKQIKDGYCTWISIEKMF